ncbi:MAG: hypothetical protein H0W02_10305 [Ktedonobacteraceae bacterium]|nr:hypothetical protein [Ktedonobacteraceae bacterium]
MADLSEDDLLTSRQAIKILAETWQRPVTIASFRMLRRRRKNDPSMPKPAFSDGDVLLWRRGDLNAIKPPAQGRQKVDTGSERGIDKEKAIE